jgi:hypothetical protein
LCVIKYVFSRWGKWDLILVLYHAFMCYYEIYDMIYDILLINRRYEI